MRGIAAQFCTQSRAVFQAAIARVAADLLWQERGIKAAALCSAQLDPVALPLQRAVWPVPDDAAPQLRLALPERSDQRAQIAQFIGYEAWS